MPMILNPPLSQPSYCNVAYDRPFPSRLAQGSEGRAIEEKIRDVRRELPGTNDSRGVVDDGAGSEYRHLPLQTAGTIRVRFREAVPMQPRQFRFDDEAE